MRFPAHMQVFIVGGYVRDRLLNRECKDHDFVVVGATPDEMLAMGFQKVGADFPVFLHPLTGDEFALARTERKVGSGYNGFETDFSTDVTLEDDLARRDLTINSMAREVLGFNDLGHAKLSDDIVDPFRGQEDLRDGVLRHTTEAFAEDPLRVLRVARFRARFGFSTHWQTMELMQDLVTADEMEALTTERVWAETEKAMTEANPWLFFHTLFACGALSRLFPGLAPGNQNLNGLTPTQRMMVVFSHAPLELLVGLKAPGEVVRLVTKLQSLMSHDNDALVDPQNMLGALKALDAFRQPDDVADVTKAMGVANSTLHTRGLLVNFALEAAQEVSFASLTDEQQATLKGKDVGEAIDRLRLERLAANVGH